MAASKEKCALVIVDCFTDSLTNSLKKHGVNAQNFFKTLSLVPSLDEDYVRAQHSRAELFMDQIIEIADNEPDANKARNQIQVRQFYASKMKPNKFGDRIDVNMTTTVDIRGALDEARNRIREVLDISKTQLIDNTTTIVECSPGSKPGDLGSTVKNELDELLE